MQTPYPHHCCVKRGSLILSGLQILLWGPDCVETGKPMHRRLTGPLFVFCTLSHAGTGAHINTHYYYYHHHLWMAANATAVTGERCSLLQTKTGIVRILSSSHRPLPLICARVQAPGRNLGIVGGVQRCRLTKSQV